MKGHKLLVRRSAVPLPTTTGASVPVPASVRESPPVDLAEAFDFLRLLHGEHPEQRVPLRARMRQVRQSVETVGTYRHTPEELTFGARVAWRNSSRCIGRLYWNSLKVLDRRTAVTSDQIHRHLVEHLRTATNGGRVRPVISVFAPETPTTAAPRVWNSQLVRYAGYRLDDGRVLGDPANVAFTETVRRLGWRARYGRFDLLPLVVEGADGQGPALYDLDPRDVLEVPLTHPEHRFFAGLGLRWHAVPAISHMRLRIGGVDYPLAPFNGWYMGTEIGARNLTDSDRYDLLPAVAAGLGLDTSREDSLWRDRALVETNVAVLHSFRAAGVRVTDHHTESRRFLTHLAREEAAGRRVSAEWSWIVPPMSGGITPVFHRYYDEQEQRPAFYLDEEARDRAEGRAGAPAAAGGGGDSGCPAGRHAPDDGGAVPPARAVPPLGAPAARPAAAGVPLSGCPAGGVPAGSDDHG
ncbi:nitric oxide synthase oxygenase [Streptomyces spiramenti]|uniref:Nitric oxide synthase oxygenase n=1 Tax=Streptomyces spiramenti TaxID=2720606 RepID=A0ABX1AXJ1_9ACTN|nr:nitric oxide synthase oxygenase [Streptomyces spiramenti]NJP68952.1 nitric oxide synthase oxygenase [Streptomyces spiramenti]